MLILFNKAITVACFAMRCWQFFLLPHFSQSIDADTNVSAAHSLKLQRKIGWDLLWGGNPCHSLDGNIFVSALLLSPINVPTLSSCCKGHLTFSVGVRCPRGDIQPCSGVTSSRCSGCRGHCWHPSLETAPAASASLLSSRVRVGAASWVLDEGFGIKALNLGPSLQSPGFQCDLGRLSFALTLILCHLTCAVAWKSWILFVGLLQSSLNLPEEIQLQEAAMGSLREIFASFI